MPTYTYKCPQQIEETPIERNVPISERDNQVCSYCGEALKRTISFTGLTWAPTAGGMR